MLECWTPISIGKWEKYSASMTHLEWKIVSPKTILTSIVFMLAQWFEISNPIWKLYRVKTRPVLNSLSRDLIHKKSSGIVNLLLLKIARQLLIEFYCCKKFQLISFWVSETDYFPNEIPKNRSLQCTVRVCLETIYAKLHFIYYATCSLITVNQKF